jgi:threonine/homoserine/homoserine lactone efflux protein
MFQLLYELLKGFIFGITMAAVPGPIFFLIVQRTLAEGALTGLFCGLGAVTADVTYAIIAAVGLSFIFQFIMQYQSWFAFAGGAFLIYLGVTTYFRKVSTETIVVEDTRFITAWLSTFLLTLANPVTIISYCIIFASFGVDTENKQYSALGALVCGVIIGATSFVVILISILRYFRKKLSSSMVRTINKIAAIILIVFGIIALVRSFNVAQFCKSKL